MSIVKKIDDIQIRQSPRVVRCLFVSKNSTGGLRDHLPLLLRGCEGFELAAANHARVDVYLGPDADEQAVAACVGKL